MAALGVLLSTPTQEPLVSLVVFAAGAAAVLFSCALGASYLRNASLPSVYTTLTDNLDEYASADDTAAASSSTDASATDEADARPRRRHSTRRRRRRSVE